MKDDMSVRRAVYAAEAKLSVTFIRRQTRLKSQIYVGDGKEGRPTLVLKVIQRKPRASWAEDDVEITVFGLLSSYGLAPRLVNSSTHDGAPWHVSEFCPYPCLTGIRSELRSDLNAAIPLVGASLLAWIKSAHSIGFAHMDIALDHVFLSETGHVQMVDFEHSIMLGEGDNRVRRWADVFCVVQILCELCTGKRYQHWSDYSTAQQAISIVDGLEATALSMGCLKEVRQLANLAANGLFTGGMGVSVYDNALATFE